MYGLILRPHYLIIKHVFVFLYILVLISQVYFYEFDDDNACPVKVPSHVVPYAVVGIARTNKTISEPISLASKVDRNYQSKRKKKEECDIKVEPKVVTKSNKIEKKISPPADLKQKSSNDKISPNYDKMKSAYVAITRVDSFSSNTRPLSMPKFTEVQPKTTEVKIAQPGVVDNLCVVSLLSSTTSLGSKTVTKTDKPIQNVQTSSTIAKLEPSPEKPHTPIKISNDEKFSKTNDEIKSKKLMDPTAKTFENSKIVGTTMLPMTESEGIQSIDIQPLVTKPVPLTSTTNCYNENDLSKTICKQTNTVTNSTTKEIDSTVTEATIQALVKDAVSRKGSNGGDQHIALRSALKSPKLSETTMFSSNVKANNANARMIYLQTPMTHVPPVTTSIAQTPPHLKSNDPEKIKILKRLQEVEIEIQNKQKRIGQMHFDRHIAEQVTENITLESGTIYLNSQTKSKSTIASTNHQQGKHLNKCLQTNTEHNNIALTKVTGSITSTQCSVIAQLDAPLDLSKPREGNVKCVPPKPKRVYRRKSSNDSNKSPRRSPHSPQLQIEQTQRAIQQYLINKSIENMANQSKDTIPTDASFFDKMKNKKLARRTNKYVEDKLPLPVQELQKNFISLQPIEHSMLATTMGSNVQTSSVSLVHEDNGNSTTVPTKSHKNTYENKKDTSVSDRNINQNTDEFCPIIVHVESLASPSAEEEKINTTPRRQVDTPQEHAQIKHSEQKEENVEPTKQTEDKIRISIEDQITERETITKPDENNDNASLKGGLGIVVEAALKCEQRTYEKDATDAFSPAINKSEDNTTPKPHLKIEEKDNCDIEKNMLISSNSTPNDEQHSQLDNMELLARVALSSVEAPLFEVPEENPDETIIADTNSLYIHPQTDDTSVAKDDQTSSVDANINETTSSHLVKKKGGRKKQRKGKQQKYKQQEMEHTDTSTSVQEECSDNKSTLEDVERYVPKHDNDNLEATEDAMPNIMPGNSRQTSADQFNDYIQTDTNFVDKDSDDVWQDALDLSDSKNSKLFTNLNACIEASTEEEDNNQENVSRHNLSSQSMPNDLPEKIADDIPDDKSGPLIRVSSFMDDVNAYESTDIEKETPSFLCTVKTLVDCDAKRSADKLLKEVMSGISKAKSNEIHSAFGENAIKTEKVPGSNTMSNLSSAEDASFNINQPTVSKGNMYDIHIKKEFIERVSQFEAAQESSDEDNAEMLYQDSVQDANLISYFDDLNKMTTYTNNTRGRSSFRNSASRTSIHKSVSPTPSVSFNAMKRKVFDKSWQNISFKKMGGFSRGKYSKTFSRRGQYVKFSGQRLFGPFSSLNPESEKITTPSQRKHSRSPVDVRAPLLRTPRSKKSPPRRNSANKRHFDCVSKSSQQSSYTTKRDKSNSPNRSTDKPRQVNQFRTQTKPKPGYVYDKHGMLTKDPSIKTEDKSLSRSPPRKVERVSISSSTSFKRNVSGSPKRTVRRRMSISPQSRGGRSNSFSSRSNSTDRRSLSRSPTRLYDIDHSSNVLSNFKKGFHSPPSQYTLQHISNAQPDYRRSRSNSPRRTISHRKVEYTKTNTNMPRTNSRHFSPDSSDSDTFDHETASKKYRSNHYQSSEKSSRMSPISRRSRDTSTPRRSVSPASSRERHLRTISPVSRYTNDDNDFERNSNWSHVNIKKERDVSPRRSSSHVSEQWKSGFDNFRGESSRNSIDNDRDAPIDNTLSRAMTSLLKKVLLGGSEEDNSTEGRMADMVLAMVQQRVASGNLNHIAQPKLDHRGDNDTYRNTFTSRIISGSSRERHDDEETTDFDSYRKSSGSSRERHGDDESTGFDSYRKMQVYSHLSDSELQQQINELNSSPKSSGASHYSYSKSYNRSAKKHEMVKNTFTSMGHSSKEKERYSHGSSSSYQGKRPYVHKEETYSKRGRKLSPSQTSDARKQNSHSYGYNQSTYERRKSPDEHIKIERSTSRDNGRSRSPVSHRSSSTKSRSRSKSPRHFDKASFIAMKKQNLRNPPTFFTRGGTAYRRPYRRPYRRTY